MACELAEPKLSRKIVNIFFAIVIDIFLKDFNAGDEYIVTIHINELGQTVRSGDFKNLELALIAFGAVAQQRAQKAINAGKKLGYGKSMTGDQLYFWSYVFFQSPGPRGQSILKNAGSWDFSGLPFDKETKYPLGIQSKAYRILATWRYVELRKTL